MTTPATDDELLAAYHRTSLWRGGITFMRAKQMPAVRASLELGAAVLRNPPPPRFDLKLAQANDMEQA
jgi:hypothetical protein